MHKFADSNDLYYILLQFRVLLHDAALGKVAIDPRTCGSFAVAFWLVDGLNNPI